MIKVISQNDFIWVAFVISNIQTCKNSVKCLGETHFLFLKRDLYFNVWYNLIWIIHKLLGKLIVLQTNKRNKFPKI